MEQNNQNNSPSNERQGKRNHKHRYHKNRHHKKPRPEKIEEAVEEAPKKLSFKDHRVSNSKQRKKK